MQGKGLGKILLHRLAEAAVERSVHRFRCTVRAGSDVPGLGEVSLDGPTAAAYTRLGGATALGAPTGMAEKVGDGTVTPFANGTIFTSPAGSYLVQGEILKRYTEEQGGPTGSLGWPTADETTTGGGAKVANGGWISEFQNGTITWLNDGKGNFSETVTKK